MDVDEGEERHQGEGHERELDDYIDEANQQKLNELLQFRVKRRQIDDYFGVHRSTLNRWIKKLGDRVVH